MTPDEVEAGLRLLARLVARQWQRCDRCRRPATRDAKAREWSFLQSQERARGYKRGWAWHRYRAKYGENPQRSAP